jgi:uroporphyrin-III C-methyltransferase/precorrin-2 dehydrogenase/sirohydrochlorin ferrochelatase
MSLAKLRYLPLSIDVADRRVLLLGDGMAALAKLRLLLRTTARVTVFAPSPEPDLAALIARHGLTHVPAAPGFHDLRGAALVFVATGVEAADARMAGLARKAGIPVNVVDRPALSDFAVPALIDRAPITIAVASDGVAPVLAQKVRALIEGLLPSAFGNLGEIARQIRPTVLRSLSGSAERRRFWWRIFDGRAGAAALSGDLDGARAIALDELQGVATESPSGRIAFIGDVAPSEDLLTLRAHRLLLSADVVVHDREITGQVLEMARRDATLLAAPAARSEIVALLTRLGHEGQQVVRLSANDPLLLAAEIAALGAAGIACESVPSPAALARRPVSIAA